MCLLEVAMCDKCRSSRFQLEGAGEGGVKNFRIGGGGLPTCGGGGGLLLLGGQYPITCHDSELFHTLF